ncbi:MAG: ribbon-helix-helix protein, CopG family [Okeania sp. SIO2C2]|uniref:CopG family ribbon-helix-helix protein n=1 Tax=Okeania sp. SIO2C2 TaxID=2607787 RepID=UPI0013B5E81B|nr:ribbon-helix-helix protein, CopG family [Okeania sp. SIO2C2]NEP86477.1 ribbon-helix-helix protein, CopG family [Okeania sp. SIO2C2]
METISFSLNSEKRKAIDKIASLLERSRSEILNDAVDAYLQVQQWQLEYIKEGLRP